MKAKLFLIAAAFLCFTASAVSAQESVTITSRKITYKRVKPMDKIKASFTVNYPKIKAATTALARQIENSISYAKVLELDIEEERTEMQWLEEADYEVLYNNKGFLAVKLSITGTGAYPSTSSEVVLVNLKNGLPVAAADVFDKLDALAAELKKQQEAEIVQAKKEIKEDPETAGEDFDDIFANADFTAENIKEFSIDDRGVTFYYDYGFGHAIQALQPSGIYRLTWAEVKSFTKPNGAFAKFIK